MKRYSADGIKSKLLTAPFIHFFPGLWSWPPVVPNGAMFVKVFLDCLDLPSSPSLTCTLAKSVRNFGGKMTVTVLKRLWDHSSSIHVFFVLCKKWFGLWGLGAVLTVVIIFYTEVWQVCSDISSRNGSLVFLPRPCLLSLFDMYVCFPEQFTNATG